MSKYTVKESNDRVERDVADVFREESRGRRISTSGRASRRKGFKGAVKFPSDITTDKAYKKSGEVMEFQLGHLTPEELQEMLQNSPSVRKIVAERIERETHALQEGISYAVGVAVGPLVTEMAAALRLLAGQVGELQQQIGAVVYASEQAPVPMGRAIAGGSTYSDESGRSGAVAHEPSSRRARRRTRRDWSDPDHVIFSSLERLHRDGVEIDRATEVLAHDSTVYQRALKRYGRWKDVLAAFYRRSGTTLVMGSEKLNAPAADGLQGSSGVQGGELSHGISGDSETDIWEAIERERRGFKTAVGADV